ALQFSYPEYLSLYIFGLTAVCALAGKSLPKALIATTLGLILSRCRLRIDRLAPGGQRIVVDPDRGIPGRWPLLPLADWKAGKIPVCVVNDDGRVFVESEADPVIIHGQAAEELIG
ncbi:MAG: hypothetical protein R3236_06175, partial [Phycisphaeraceae bacterium]|nr:hypothetical protein [Phycisphaeraceae bacterium]